MTAADLLVKLRQALADLDDAEQRFTAIRTEGRRRHAALGPAVADMRYRDHPQMRQAMEDWGTAHTRIQSYGAALSGMLLAEFLRPEVVVVDAHDLHAMPSPDALPVDLAASHAVGGGRRG